MAQSGLRQPSIGRIAFLLRERQRKTAIHRAAAIVRQIGLALFPKSSVNSERVMNENENLIRAVFVQLASVFVGK